MDQETELANLEYDNISPETVESVKNGQTQPPRFPILIFSLAATKDIIDIISLGTVGALINILVIPILFLHVRKQIGSVKKRLYRRLILNFAAELIPGLNIVPFWSVFVVLGYLKEREHIGKITDFLESFAK